MNNQKFNNNDSMMNINPFMPASSEINSKLSYNFKSQSSISKDGQEVVFTMKESLRDLDSFNISPEKTPQIMQETFQQSFNPLQDSKKSKRRMNEVNLSQSFEFKDLDKNDELYDKISN